MSLVSKLFFSLAAALVLGGGSAVLALMAQQETVAVSNTGWVAQPAGISDTPGPYERASIVFGDPLAPATRELVMLTRAADEAGNALSSACHYTITGRPLPATWWSVTAYGENGQLIPNTLDKYGFNSGNVARQSGGKFSIHLAPTPRAGDRIPTGSVSQPISLALRLYRPDEIAQSTIAQSTAGLPDLPRVDKVSCP